MLPTDNSVNASHCGIVHRKSFYSNTVAEAGLFYPQRPSLFHIRNISRPEL